MLRRLVPLALVLAFASCSRGGAPHAPTAQGAGEADTPVEIARLRRYRADWRAVPEGRAPADLVDVRDDGHHYPWLYDGGWQVGHTGGGPLLRVPDALREPPEPLSFRRYDGAAFGPGGALPMRYRIEAEARSLGGSTRFNGFGEVAIQALYLSPVRYVEVLQTDGHFFIWEADDAPPMQGKGWRQLAKVAHPVAEGEWIRFGAEVGRRTGTITALLDGAAVATASSPLLRTEGPARFTIRATGNREEWRALEVRELP